jgi:hypothetical protein
MQAANAPKRLSEIIILHDVTTQKIIIWAATAVKALKIIKWCVIYEMIFTFVPNHQHKNWCKGRLLSTAPWISDFEP